MSSEKNTSENIQKASDASFWASRKPHKIKRKGALNCCPDLKLLANNPRNLTNAIASEEELNMIAEAWKSELKIPEKDLFEAAISLALYCADNGSSAHTTLPSSDSKGFNLEALAGLVKQVTTLRRFCGSYAPVIWNIMISENKPPSNWVRNRVIPSARFSSFDFFEAVTNPNAIIPPGGLCREPTFEEFTAAATSKDVKINRTAAKQGTHSSLYAEISGGRVGPKPDLHINNAPSN